MDNKFQLLNDWLEKNMFDNIILKVCLLSFFKELHYNIYNIEVKDNECFVFFKYNQYILLKPDATFLSLYNNLLNIKSYLSDEYALGIMSIVCNWDLITFYHDNIYENTIINHLKFLSKEIKKEFLDLLHRWQEVGECSYRLTDKVKIISMRNSIGIVSEFSLYDEKLLKTQIKHSNLVLQMFENYKFVNTLMGD